MEETDASLGSGLGGLGHLDLRRHFFSVWLFRNNAERLLPARQRRCICLMMAVGAEFPFQEALRNRGDAGQAVLSHSLALKDLW